MPTNFAHLHTLPEIGQVLVIKNSYLHDPAISVLYRVDGVTLDAGLAVHDEHELNQTFERLGDEARAQEIVELFHKELIEKCNL